MEENKTDKSAQIWPLEEEKNRKISQMEEKKQIIFTNGKKNR